MSDSRIITFLNAGLKVVKTLAPVAVPATVGALSHEGKELARSIADESMKEGTKNFFGNISSSVNLISALGCNAEGLYMLIQAWPHLSKKERVGFSILLAGSAALSVYPTAMFGSEKQIFWNSALSTASVLAAKATSLYAEHVVESNVRTAYSPV